MHGTCVSTASPPSSRPRASRGTSRPLFCKDTHTGYVYPYARPWHRPRPYTSCAPPLAPPPPGAPADVSRHPSSRAPANLSGGAAYGAGQRRAIIHLLCARLTLSLWAGLVSWQHLDSNMVSRGPNVHVAAITWRSSVPCFMNYRRTLQRCHQ